jgi:pimeloyl-ACP methyl ester carboxylesterase
LDKWNGMLNLVRRLLLIALVLNTAGCGRFIARSIARAPNRYSTWLAPEAPVTLAFNPKLLTNFAKQYVEVGPPSARLMYRIIEPADYHLKVAATNWLDHGGQKYEFSFRAALPAGTNGWSAAPRGTVVLLHGYGVAQFAMLPWALRLAQDGWRCVLVDLRGHGKSTGRQIYFGLRETNDMSQLLDALARDQKLAAPVAMVGESYGAILALRCKMVDPRVQSVVAFAPYASLSNTVLNIRREYAAWFPAPLIKAGIRQLPAVLQFPASEFDTTTVLRRQPVAALFVAGGADKISPAKDVEALRALASPGSEFILVPDATHEALTYYFAELVPAVLAWLDGKKT